MQHSLRTFLCFFFLTPFVPAQSILVNASGRLAQFESTGSIQWELPWTFAGDLQALPNGNVLAQAGPHELALIVPDLGQVVWEYDVRSQDETARLAAFEVIGDEKILLALAGPNQFLEINYRRQVLTRTSWGADLGPLSDVQLQADGQYLACFGQTLYSIEPKSGKHLWSSKLGEREERPCVLQQTNASILAGYGSELLHITAQGQVQRRQDLAQLPAFRGTILASIQSMGDGGLAVLAEGVEGDRTELVAIDLASGSARSLSADQELGSGPVAAQVLHQGSEGARLQRAQRLHRDVLTLDTHKDISSNLAAPAPREVADNAQALEAFALAHDPTRWGNDQVDFPKMRAGGLDCAFFIVYAGQGSLDDEGFALAERTAREKFTAIHRMCERYPDSIELARNADDVERIAAKGKLVCAIGIENGFVMGRNLDLIEEFHRLGARYMSLTHNGHSQLGDSHTPEEAMHDGLTELGAKAVAELNRVGIMVDVSHASKQTMMAATALSKAPVIASHSGAHAVRAHGRNLDDEQLRALAKNGGVIQCVAFSSYVTDTSKRDLAVRAARKELGLPSRFAAGPADTSPEAQAKRRQLRERVAQIEAQNPPSDVVDFVDHIDHAVKVAGIDHVAISSDFDGGGGVVGWNDAAQTFAVTMELCRRDYTDEQIAQLWSGNTLRVWRRVEEVAAELQATGK